MVLPTPSPAPNSTPGRGLTLALTALAACSACTPTRGATPSVAPTLTPASPTLRSPELGLPFHSAGIVDLALLPPQPGEQWRLASGDAEGWVRVWADGKLLAAWHAHPGGLSALQLAADGSWYTAGFDGRVLEWRAESTAPVRAFNHGSPITALAVAGPHLAISDGRSIQLWSRAEQPELVWSMLGHGFVTGLALSPSGGVVAAAELRQWALREGIATHPLAPFDDGGSRGVDPDEQAQLRAMATHDFPGAVADYVEVWQPSHERARRLVPSAPIDGDLAVLSRGGVVYREIYDRNNAGLIGRRLEDQAHFPLELVKPWAFWTTAAGHPTEASQGKPNLPAGDFRLGPNEEILVLDHFPGWGTQPPERGWRAGDRRELAVDHHHAAIGDGQGNLAVVAWARPAETGWLAAASERPDLLTTASGTAQIVTATLEPRTHYRLWSLTEGRHRSIRVEAPWQVLPDPNGGEGEQPVTDPAAGLPIFPFTLALDSQAQTLVTSSSSYSTEEQAAVRVIRVANGGAQILTLATTPAGLDLGVSPSGTHILAWAPGAPARSWAAPSATEGWTAGPDALGGSPRFSANGAWSAHVSGFERHIVDLQAHEVVVALPAEKISEDVGEGLLAAIADDGSLAVVQPFGGGTLERIDVSGQRELIELPGAATALDWVPTAEGPTLVIGFLDGSIARIDGNQVLPIHAGAGGRIWGLGALGGQLGIFVELDERGLTVHRLVDDATLELYLADNTSLARWDGSSTQALRGEDLVVVWRPGSAMAPCRILDGTSAGVLAPENIERWPIETGAELFGQFFAGSSCVPQPEQNGDREANPDDPKAGDPSPDDPRPNEATPSDPSPGDPGASTNDKEMPDPPLEPATSAPSE